jgi:hypothetical protein
VASYLRIAAISMSAIGERLLPKRLGAALAFWAMRFPDNMLCFSMRGAEKAPALQKNHDRYVHLSTENEEAPYE